MTKAQKHSPKTQHHHQQQTNNDDEYEGDLKSLRDQLKVLRDLLGESYVEYIGEDDDKDKPPTRSTRKLPPLPNNLPQSSLHAPSSSSSPPPTIPQQINLYTEALNANRTLQHRLRRLLESIATAQNNCQEIKDRIKTVAAKKRSALQAPFLNNNPRRNIKQPLFSGQSWFWSLSNKPPPPPYPDHQVTADILQHIPTIQQRTTWSDEERQSLKDGVVQRIQELRFKSLLEETEQRILEQGIAISPHELQILQAPIKALTASSPEVITAAEHLTMDDWESIAHRSIPGKSSMDCKLQWLNVVCPIIKNDEWSREEDERLVRLVEENGMNSWQLIASLLMSNSDDNSNNTNNTNNTNNNNNNADNTMLSLALIPQPQPSLNIKQQQRTPLMCLTRYQHIQQQQRRPRPQTELTPLEINHLTALVTKHGSSWPRIAQEFNKHGWDGDRLMHVYRRHSQRTEGGRVVPRIGRWSADEDDALRQAVAVYGSKWSLVATLVPGRTDVQCRERYTGVLGAGERKVGHFSTEEDAVLRAAVESCTNENGSVSWAAVAKLVPGRNDSQCSKRWNWLHKEVRSPKERKKSGGSGGSKGGGRGRGKRSQQQRAVIEEVDIEEVQVEERETKRGRAVKTPGWLRKGWTS